MHRAPSRHSARYTELRPTPRASAIWATVSSRWSYIRRAALALSGVITVGRPPLRPRARAAALRAADRSRINSRSNSASAPNTRKDQSAAERARATRDWRIVAAATKLFVRDGYLQTTMADIAREAGVAVQTLYCPSAARWRS